MKADSSPRQAAEVMVAEVSALTPAVCQQTITNITKVTDDAFYLMNMDDIVAKYLYWTKKLPHIKPYYAVKCNNHPHVLQLLNSLGSNFDCASKAEIRSVLEMGVSADRIILANPCKPASHIRYAAANNVFLTTFDNASELYKIQELMPQARLVLRIRVDAIDCQCPLGLKFGVPVNSVEQLVKLAAVLKLQLVGVSFHVGSGCREPAAFARAIAAAADVFQAAERLQLPPLSLLDIGGGLLGNDGNRSLDEAAVCIERAVREHFSPHVQMIAEPGRYMVQSAFTLATQVVSVRREDESRMSTDEPCYYVNDGVYGAFNCVLYDHQVCTPQPVDKTGDTSDFCDESLLAASTVFGPTCDSLDTICRGVLLPPLSVGSWLMWRNMGAYTLASSGTFNGFPRARVYALASSRLYREGLADAIPVESVSRLSALGVDVDDEVTLQTLHGGTPLAPLLEPCCVVEN